MFERCLICTDFTDGLHRLVHFVPSLAAGGMKQIVFLHSVPLWQDRGIPREDTDKIQQARDRLSAALQNVPDGVEVKVDISSGKPLDSIIKAAATYQADLILLGMPIRSLLQEKLFGSTTSGLARSIKTPLMILRPQLISTYTIEELDLRCRHLCRYLLVPYDGSESSEYVVQKIKQSAQNPHRSLEGCHLCWVIDEGGRLQLRHEAQLKQAQEKLATVKAELEHLGKQVAVDLRRGDTVTEILEAAMEFDINAIAISSDTIGKFLEWPTPSCAAEVMRRSWHPVLFFPPHK